MTGSSAGYHEPVDSLPTTVVDQHRAIASLMEELEAIDWYEQRIAATSDPDLAAILRHNSNEEREHAAMVLEWLRRRDPELDRYLRRFLFTDGSITGLGDDGDTSEALDGGPASGAGQPTSPTTGDLAIGKIRSTP